VSFSNLPFLILACKDTPLSLKRLILYLLPVLFLSSLFFGWLNETRNYMPVVFLRAIVAGRYFDAQPSQAEAAQRPSDPSLVQISFSDRLIWIAVVKNKSAIGLIAISPVGTAENQSCQRSFSDWLIRIAVVKNKSAIGRIAISPVGTAENSPGRARISCEACWSH
jgi:hypothetical protein